MSENRHEFAILADIITAKTEYATLMTNQDRTARQESDAVALIKQFSAEFDAYLTNGASACKRCSHKPIGMLKTPTYVDRGVRYPDVFEIGCAYCDPYLVQREADGTDLVLHEGASVFEHDNPGKATMIGAEPVTMKVKRRSFSARALSAAAARDLWNAQEFVEDTLFDRIPGFTPEYAETAATIE